MTRVVINAEGTIKLRLDKRIMTIYWNIPDISHSSSSACLLIRRLCMSGLLNQDNQSG